jgi:hypothetical protein
MPRSRRRRANDRSREARQREAARQAFTKIREAEHANTSRYVRSVLRHRVGEIVPLPDGHYEVQSDGSFKKVEG